MLCSQLSDFSSSIDVMASTENSRIRHWGQSGIGGTANVYCVTLWSVPLSHVLPNILISCF